jgi:hypothetical protein
MSLGVVVPAGLMAGTVCMSDTAAVVFFAPCFFVKSFPVLVCLQLCAFNDVLVHHTCVSTAALFFMCHALVLLPHFAFRQYSTQQQQQ